MLLTRRTPLRLLDCSPGDASGDITSSVLVLIGYSFRTQAPAGVTAPPDDW